MSQGSSDDVPRAWGDIHKELERSLGASKELPILKFYRDFADDWQTYAPEVKLEILHFLEELQKGPCSPDILARCERADRYYACRLERCGAVVFWSLELDGDFLTISTPPDKICILAVEFDV